MCGRKSDYSHLASIDIVTRSKMGTGSEGFSSLSLIPLSSNFYLCVEGKKRKTQLELDAEDAAQGKHNRAKVNEVAFPFPFSISLTLFLTNLNAFFTSSVQPCPECGHQWMYFSTMQLRSVDEGQTVFYECVKCHHKYSVNT